MAAPHAHPEAEPEAGAPVPPRRGRRPFTEHVFEYRMGLLLRAGVLTAAALVLAGGVVYLAQHGAAPHDYHTFRGAPRDFRTLRGIWHDARALQGEGLILLGALVLIATPVLRVAYALLGFLRLRDGLYVGVSLVVLGVLLYSLFAGHA